MPKVYIATSRPEEIGNLCSEWAAQNLPEGFSFTENLEECEIFISVMYDTLLQVEFLAQRRCYNFHPGILPDYRGSGVYSWVIINREKETGVTLHEIDTTIDTGPIIEIRKTLISPNDTAFTLFSRCMEILFTLFREYFHDILFNQYTTRPNEGGRLYLREDLEKAKDISHLVRAFSFKEKESLYWRNPQGSKRYLKWIT